MKREPYRFEWSNFRLSPWMPRKFTWTISQSSNEHRVSCEPAKTEFCRALPEKSQSSKVARSRNERRTWAAESFTRRNVARGEPAARDVGPGEVHVLEEHPGKVEVLQDDSRRRGAGEAAQRAPPRRGCARCTCPSRKGRACCIPCPRTGGGRTYARRQ